MSTLQSANPIPQRSAAQEITRCRICGNSTLVPILDLGVQMLTGVFPRTVNSVITSGPLQLVKCHGDSEDCCQLVQLRHSYELNEMYGDNYGYRSGLNRSMVEHLKAKVTRLQSMVAVGAGDLVLDIGSNDGTLLSGYAVGGPLLVGIDPTADKFRQYYRSDIRIIPDFFSGEVFKRVFGSQKAKIVTSIAMFYDLADPLAFMQQIHSILADEGVWHFEQSYMPTMLQVNAYDTVCHEHLEYYGLRQIEWMAKRCGFFILDVELNDTNGGSFAVTLAKKGSSYRSRNDESSRMLAAETALGLHTLAPYAAFEKQVFEHRDQLMKTLHDLRQQGKSVLGYGASTKGNVILQFCGINLLHLPAIAEVNPDKFGCFTPGSNILIIPESQARALKPDYFLVFPWHFRKNLVEREQAFLASGGKLLFPLPEIDIVAKS